MRLAVACADVGSVEKGNFGWAICEPPGAMLEVPDHSSIEQLANEISHRLNKGEFIALGLECPLFVPISDDPVNLTRARVGEGNRPWSAGAGSGALAIGVAEATWLLSRVKGNLTVPPTATVEWAAFVSGSARLFLWEAFVSRTSKATSHHGDAALAVAAFCRALPNPEEADMIRSVSVFSLIGAALLRSGWLVPTNILERPCIVIAA